MQKKLLVQFSPAFLYFLLTVYLFTLPGNQIPSIDWMHKLQVDKLVHFSLFFVLVFLLYLPFYKKNYPIKTKNIFLISVVIICIGYGIAVEFIQKYYIPNRSFDLYDIVADTLGSVVAYWFVRKK